MFSVPRLRVLCLFVVGLIATVLVTSVAAIPVEGVEVLSGSIARSVDIFSVGEFADPATGLPFELYSADKASAAVDVFNSYLTGFNDTSPLIVKRGWYDCKHTNDILTSGCHTRSGFGSFVRSTGIEAARIYISMLLKEAFDGSRNSRRPRSACLSRHGDSLCISWAAYDFAKLKTGEAKDIEDTAIHCSQKDHSAAFKTIMDDGGILPICVSGRAYGCKQSVCGSIHTDESIGSSVV